MSKRPMPLDDEDYPPKPLAPVLWAVAKWGCVGFGLVFAVVALTAGAIQAAPLAGLACFFGIAARLAQAEQHRPGG